MIKQIRNAKSVQSKAKKNVVHPLGDNRYQVVSASSGNVYNVRVHGDCATCDCNWGAHRPAHDQRSGCSHVIATFGFIAEENGRKVSVWNSEADADRQHRPMLHIGNGVVLTSRAA
jgi:hypothetical protein